MAVSTLFGTRIPRPFALRAVLLKIKLQVAKPIYHHPTPNHFPTSPRGVISPPRLLPAALVEIVSREMVAGAEAEGPPPKCKLPPWRAADHCTIAGNTAFHALVAVVAEVPDFVSVFNHLSDSASFFGCFVGPETAPAITELPIRISSALLPSLP